MPSVLRGGHRGLGVDPYWREALLSEVLKDGNGERVDGEAQQDSTAEETERRPELVRGSL